MGVWIEIIYVRLSCVVVRNVTPCVGVWIEIMLPSVFSYPLSPVTPCVGVWIEMATCSATSIAKSGHSLRGSVD